MSDVTLNTASGAITLTAANSSGNKTLTLPAVSDTLVGKATTDTLTNKSIVATQLTGTIAASRLPAGSVLQVVQGTNSTQTSTTSSSLVDTGLSVTITPSSSSSKILAIVSQNFHESQLANNRDESEGRIALLRNSIILQDGPVQVGITSYSQAKRWNFMQTFSYLDSPSTTSTLTYKTMMRTTGFESITANNQAATGTIILLEIAG